MDIIPIAEEEPDKDPHQINALAPKQRSTIILLGSTGSGKTNLVSNLILRYLKAHNLYIYTKFPDATTYQNMFKKLRHELGDKAFESQIHVKKDLLNVIDPDDLNADERNIVVFDDMMNKSDKDKKKITSYYTEGRHANCTTFNLVQSFTGTPMDTRKNISHIALFRGRTPISDADLARVMEFVGWNGIGDLQSDKDSSPKSKSKILREFKELYNYCTRKDFGFLWIDNAQKNPCLRYRCGFDSLFNPDYKSNKYGLFVSVPYAKTLKHQERNIQKVLDHISPKQTGLGLSEMWEEPPWRKDKKSGLKESRLIKGEKNIGNDNPLLDENIASDFYKEQPIRKIPEEVKKHNKEMLRMLINSRI